MDPLHPIPVKEVIPFDVHRKAVASKTFEGWSTAPHAGGVLELDATQVQRFRRELKRDPDYEGSAITLNIILVKIIAEALKASPQMNSHVAYNPKNTLGELTVFDEINIAVPFITPDFKTIFPVLKDVGRKSLKQLAVEMEDLRRRVANTNLDLLLLQLGRMDTRRQLRRLRFGVLRRVYTNLFGPKRLTFPPKAEREKYYAIPESDRITPADVLCATTLVTNLGSVLPQVHGFVTLLDIIPPQAIVFALSAIRKTPVVVTNDAGEDEIVIREILPMTAIGDHRAFDLTGGLGFLQRITELCENPYELAE